MRLTVRAAFSMVVAYSPRPMCLHIRQLKCTKLAWCVENKPQHHKRGKQEGSRVSNALAFDIRGGAVHSLEDGGIL
jgi:hypothetical protein